MKFKNSVLCVGNRFSVKCRRQKEASCMVLGFDPENNVSFISDDAWILGP